MKTQIALLIMCASVAAAAPATNRVAKANPANTNRVQHIEGKRQIVAIYKTQPKDRVKAKNAAGKVVELPLMFGNNRITEIRAKKEPKK